MKRCHLCSSRIIPMQCSIELTPCESWGDDSSLVGCWRNNRRTLVNVNWEMVTHRPSYRALFVPTKGAGPLSFPACSLHSSHGRDANFRSPLSLAPALSTLAFLSRALRSNSNRKPFQFPYQYVFMRKCSSAEWRTAGLASRFCHRCRHRARRFTQRRTLSNQKKISYFSTIFLHFYTYYTYYIHTYCNFSTIASYDKKKFLLIISFL